MWEKIFGEEDKKYGTPFRLSIIKIREQKLQKYLTNLKK